MPITNFVLYVKEYVILVSSQENKKQSIDFYFLCELNFADGEGNDKAFYGFFWTPSKGINSHSRRNRNSIFYEFRGVFVINLEYDTAEWRFFFKIFTNSCLRLGKIIAKCIVKY